MGKLVLVASYFHDLSSIILWLLHLKRRGDFRKDSKQTCGIVHLGVSEN